MRAGDLPVEGAMPEFNGINGWINSTSVTRADLADRVTLIDFWTYSCINCIRYIPYLNAWHEAYGNDGLTVIGIHTPEFEFEKNESNVRSQVEKFGIRYPVAMDNDYVMWKKFRNNYWPALYFIDAAGNIRYHHFGEGGYEHTESVLRALLRQAGHEPKMENVSAKAGTRTEFDKIKTPETYLGYERMEYLGSPESVRMDADQRYTAVKDPALNIFYLDGLWEIRADHAISKEPGGRIVFRIRAPKMNAVMDGCGSASRIHIRLDGRELKSNEAGSDAVIEDGRAVVKVSEGRLYNLIDTDPDREYLFDMTFLQPGVKIYSFTFG